MTKINEKELVNPFTIKPPKINESHIDLLRKWTTVWDLVEDTIGASSIGVAPVRASVWYFVMASVWDSSMNSVEDSVGIASIVDSIEDSIDEDSGQDFRGCSMGFCLGYCLGLCWFHVSKHQKMEICGS